MQSEIGPYILPKQEVVRKGVWVRKVLQPDFKCSIEETWVSTEVLSLGYPVPGKTGRKCCNNQLYFEATVNRQTDMDVNRNRFWKHQDIPNSVYDRLTRGNQDKPFLLLFKVFQILLSEELIRPADLRFLRWLKKQAGARICYSLPFETKRYHGTTQSTKWPVDFKCLLFATLSPALYSDKLANATILTEMRTPVYRGIPRWNDGSKAFYSEQKNSLNQLFFLKCLVTTSDFISSQYAHVFILVSKTFRSHQVPFLKTSSNHTKVKLSSLSKLMKGEQAKRDVEENIIRARQW